MGTNDPVITVAPSKDDKHAREPDEAPCEIVRFEADDPDNPYGWRLPKKIFISLMAVLMTINSTLSSGITSNAISSIMADLRVASSSSSSSSNLQDFLPVTLYLVGYIGGPLVFGPLSERVGRRVVVFWTFNVFLAFTLGCALAPSWPALLVFRFICGTGASVPLTVIGGVFADIYASPRTRGRAMIAFMSSTTFAPLGGPIVSGYVVAAGWRWVFWVALILGGCTWIPLVFVPETYTPVLLKWRAQRLRKAGRTNCVAPLELEDRSTHATTLTTLTRPLSMLCWEPLVYLNCLFIALVYALFYLFFQAYPIIFEGTYGFSKGQSALALAPIGVGAALSGPVLVGHDSLYERAHRRGAAWAFNEELRRLPVACLGGPFCAAALFWLGWTARAEVPWIVPCLSGIFFGFGYLLVLTALTNYLVDAYALYAASAMAASCFLRSIVGATLPLAARPLYNRLGIAWATSTLGFISLAMAAIPFGLVWCGPRIRQRSALCQDLRKRAVASDVAVEVA